MRLDALQDLLPNTIRRGAVELKTQIGDTGNFFDQLFRLVHERQVDTGDGGNLAADPVEEKTADDAAGNSGRGDHAHGNEEFGADSDGTASRRP